MTRYTGWYQRSQHYEQRINGPLLDIREMQPWELGITSSGGNKESKDHVSNVHEKHHRQ